MKHFRLLDDGHVVECPTAEWIRFAAENDGVLCHDITNNLIVETSFIGARRAYRTDPTFFFETRITGRMGMTVSFATYGTYQEAVDGHNMAVALVRMNTVQFISFPTS